MRNSSIQKVYINDLSNSSIFICGSAGCIKSSYTGSKEASEASLQQNDSAIMNQTLEPFFVRPFLAVLDCEEKKSEVEEFVILNHPSESFIRMGPVKVLSITSGTTFQIGNCASIDLKSRIQEMKQLDSPNS